MGIPFKVIIAVFLLLLTIPVKADECSDYNNKIRYPAYIKAIQMHQSILKNVGTDTSKLLKQYKDLTSEIIYVEEYKYQMEENFTDRCIGRGRLTREVFYLDDNDAVTMSYIGDVDRNEFLNSYLIPSKTWPEALGKLIIDINIKREAIKKKIIDVTTKLKISEEKRKKDLIKQKKDFDELSELVNSAINLKKSNDRKENKLILSKKQFKKSIKTESYYTDRMASYATIIGRSTACGSNPEVAISRVGNWMDKWFDALNLSDNMRATYLSIFMKGTEYHMNQQKEGKTPDSCRVTINSFNNTSWP